MAEESRATRVAIARTTTGVLRWGILAALLLSSGCGYLAIGAVAGILSLQSKNNSNPLPEPVSVQTPNGDAFDRVAINYTLTDPGISAFNVLVEYSTSGAAGPFKTATEALGAPSEGTTNLSASASGIPHRFVWNSFFDFDQQGIATAQNTIVRVTAVSTAPVTTGTTPFAYGKPALTQVFTVDNRLIATVAGASASSADGIPGIDAPLNGPAAAAVGSNGNVLVADTGDHKITLWDSRSQLVETFAGTGEGFAGDGGLAPFASFFGPRGVGVDSKFNTFISDSRNNRIRRIDAVTNVITTIAGTGTASYTGDAGPATNATIHNPGAIVFDASGNLIFSDTGNNVIRSIDGSGTIRSIAGTGVAGSADNLPALSAGLSAPQGLAIDATGGILVADSGNHAVRRFTVGGTMTTVAGAIGKSGLGAENVNATLSDLNAPSGVCLQGTAIIVADTGNNRIRSFTVGGKIVTIAGTLDGSAGFAGDNGPASAAKLNGPTQLTGDGAGGITIADTGNNRVRRITATGVMETLVGSGAVDASSIGDGGPATEATILDPFSVALAADGSFLLADSGSRRVRHIALDGTISSVAGNGQPGYTGDNGRATQATLSYSDTQVCVDPNGVIFIADDYNAVVRAVNPLTGTITTVAGGGFGPDGVATMTSFVLLSDVQYLPTRAANFSVILPDLGGNTIRRLTYTYDAASGNVTKGTTDTIAGNGAPGPAGDGGPATAASLFSPVAATVNGAGRIYILDGVGTIVRAFNVGGTISTVAGIFAPGSGGDGGPATAASFAAFAIFANPVTGFIYVMDETGHRVRRFQEGGIINTIAGDGDVGEVTPGNPLLSHIDIPSHMVRTADGSLVFTDFGSRHVLKIDGTTGNLSIIGGKSLNVPQGDGGPAVSAVVRQPLPSLAPDGTLFIGEPRFGRIRKVDHKTGQISTAVGVGFRAYTPARIGSALQSSFVSRMLGFAVDPTGTKLVIPLIDDGSVIDANFSNNKLERFTADITGIASGDNGPVSQATVIGPSDCAYSQASGALYIVDQFASNVRRVDKNGTITTVAGGGLDPVSENIPATSAFLITAGYVAVDRNETIYISEGLPASRIRKFTVGGNINTIAGISFFSGFNGDGLQATSSQLNNPLGVAVDNALNIYIADSQNYRVRRVDTSGFMTTIAGNGKIGSGPEGVPATQSSINVPWRIVLDNRGNFYVGEFAGDRVRRFRLFP